MKKYLLLFCLTLLMTACATLSEQGHEALKQGEYEKALGLFQKAKKYEPTNPDVNEGLRLAEQMWLDRKLIDVRLLRLANNFGESESLLLQVIQHENEWQVFPTGAAFSTQNEEIMLFAKRVEKRISDYLQAGNPLAAQMDFNRNNFILDKALSQNSSLIKNEIYNKGRTFCQVNQKSLKPNEYYTGQWLQKTCAIWKQPVKLPELKNSVVLFRDVKVKNAVKGLTPALSSVMDENVKKAFMQSKWHDDKGQITLDLGVEGKFTSSQSESPVERVANYFVQIPYQEISKRIKDPDRNSGVSGVFELLGALSGSSSRQSVTDNGDGTETVVTTKYRSEPRQHRYNAVEMQAKKNFDGVLLASLDKQKFKMDLNQTYYKTDDRHNENFPDVGLTPSNPIFATDDLWIQGISQELVTSLGNQLQLAWIDRFCQVDKTPGDVSEREQVFRCAYQVSAVVPEKLKQYYLKNWQIKYEDWQEMIHLN